MKAVVHEGQRRVDAEEVGDPHIEDSTRRRAHHHDRELRQRTVHGTRGTAAQAGIT